MQQLLLMFLMQNRKKCMFQVSKYNSNREKQVILLMISNREIRERSENLVNRAKFKGEGQQKYYFAVKHLSSLSRGITSEPHGDFYFLNCIHSFTTEENLNHIQKYVEIKIFTM